MNRLCNKNIRFFVINYRLFSVALCVNYAHYLYILLHRKTNRLSIFRTACCSCIIENVKCKIQENIFIYSIAPGQ